MGAESAAQNRPLDLRCKEGEGQAASDRAFGPAFAGRDLCKALPPAQGRDPGMGAGKVLVQRRVEPGLRLAADQPGFNAAPPSSKRSGKSFHPSWRWLATEAAQASYWASSELNPCSNPSSEDFRV